MYFGVKKYFETKADLEISEVRQVYEDRVNEVEDHKSSIDGELSGPEKIELKETVNRLNNKPDLTDYTKYFNGNGQKMDGVSEILRDAKEEADATGLSEEEMAEREGPQDDEPYTDEEVFPDGARSAHCRRGLRQDNDKKPERPVSAVGVHLRGRQNRSPNLPSIQICS
jgi:hypothetical protein